MSQTQNTSLIVREAVPEDAAAIGTVFQLSWLATYPNDEAGITTEDVQALALDSEENANRRAEKLAIRNGKSFRLVAEIGDRVVGQCGFECHPDYGYLRSLYVLPDFMSQGVGSALMRRALEMMGKYDRIFLAVATYNDRAIRFYRRFGFVETEEGPDFTGSPFPNGKEIPQVRMVLSKGVGV